MIKGKLAGLTVGGFTAFLLVNKVLNVARGIVSDICTANQWKNYYKYGKDGNMVAPGYSMHTHMNEDGNEVVVEDERRKQNVDSSQKPVEDVLKDSVIKAINDTFNKDKAPEGAVEGQTEASEGQNSGDTDGDKDPNVEDPQKFKDYVRTCEEKGMSEKEIALSLGMQVSEYRRVKSEILDLLRERPFVENKEPLYAEDLFDGVKVVDDTDLEGEDE